MAREVTILEDLISPNGKQWKAGQDFVVGDEYAKHLIENNQAKYKVETDLGEAIKEVITKTKKK